NLALGHGSGFRQGWYHRAGDVYYPGKKPKKDDDEDKTPIPDPHSLTEPRDQFEAVARSLGIPAERAKTTAYFVDTNHQLMDPDSVWAGLQMVHELSAANRERLWTTWNSFIGASPPPELLAKVRSVVKAEGLEPKIEVSVNGASTARRFLPVNGAVVRADDGDTTAMTFSEALQAANLQQQVQRPEPKDDSVLVALIREQGETNRAVLASQAEAANRPPDNSSDKTFELMMKWMDSRMEAERERSDKAIALIQEQNKNTVEKLSEALGEVAAAVSTRKNPFSELDELIPDLGKKLLNRLVEPPAPAPTGITATLAGGTDGQGVSVPLSVDDWVKVRTVEQRETALRTAKDSFPRLLDVGARMATAIERSSEADAKGREEAPKEYVQGRCVNPECQGAMEYTKGSKAFQCPHCSAVQTPEGRWLNEPVARQQPPSQVEEKPALEEQAEEEESTGDGPATEEGVDDRQRPDDAAEEEEEGAEPEAVPA
ncbi:MAG: hypothetical protein ACE5KY_05895, partial [Candidatus Tectimicrobiota bacterium]